MKKLTRMVMSVISVATVGCAAAGLAACGGSDAITVTGSSSVSPLMGKLADEYMKSHNVEIIVQTTDSSSGISDSQNGKNDIGMASRDLKSSETGVTAQKICTDGVALIVNTASTLTDVMGAEIYALYANGTPIQGVLTAAISREDGSGTRDAFDGLIKDDDGNALSSLTNFANCVDLQNSTGGVLSIIQANSAANTLGYISMGSLDDSVKALKFNGVEATAANVLNGTYALSRPFNIVYNSANGLSEAAQAFVDWIMSAEGQSIVTANGYISG